jgi:hypothetical protein
MLRKQTEHRDGEKQRTAIIVIKYKIWTITRNLCVNIHHPMTVGGGKGARTGVEAG